MPGFKGKVGLKGRLFPPKAIREKINLKPGTHVLYSAKKDVLTIEPIPTLEELLSMPTAAEVTIEELAAFRSKLSKQAEE